MKKEYLTFQGKVCGYIDYEKNAYISLITREHIFRKFDNGIAVSLNILKKLESEKIEDIIKVLEGWELKTTVTTMYFKGIEWEDDTFGKKELQLVLPFKFWKKGEKIWREIQTAI